MEARGSGELAHAVTQSRGAYNAGSQLCGVAARPVSMPRNDKSHFARLRSPDSQVQECGCRGEQSLQKSRDFAQMERVGVVARLLVLDGE